MQSSITLTSSLNPSVHGQAITLTAALTPETVSNAAIAQVFPRCAGFCSPTGSMSFYDGNALLGVVTAFTNSFDTFTFVLMTSQMTPGVHSLSASYGGDATYAENTSAPFVQTVLALQIVTASPLPNGFLGSPYSVTLGTNAGSGNDTWMVSGGSLPPPGISLSPGGLVSGTPTLAGSTSFTVTVTDSFGNTASATFSITVMASSPPPPSFLLRTVAGGYASTPGLGDGGLALQARLFEPDAVAVDSLGNVFIADQGNNRIRKVAPTGIITTFAGTGVVGSAGDGGPATSAQLLGAQAVTVDGTGRVYIGECYGTGTNTPAINQLRVVDSTGIINAIGGDIKPEIQLLPVRISDIAGAARENTRPQIVAHLGHGRGSENAHKRRQESFQVPCSDSVD